MQSGDGAGRGTTGGAQRLLPTTRSQVSGHRFMRRRVEHGLIYGDIRMIHDPLASRRRSAIFGLIAVVLVSAGCGLFAWLRPNPDPGSAAILRASDGSLYVRVGETVHPVTNLTSARLIAGSPEEPARVGDERLAGMHRGVPVGIAAAPAMFAPEGAVGSAGGGWSACAGGTGSETGAAATKAAPVTVFAGEPPTPLAGDEAVLARFGDNEWMVTREGRAKLPPGSEPAGRAVRRALGIDAATPRWYVDSPLLGAFRERPPVRLPEPLPRVIEAESTEADLRAWLVTPHGGIQPITEMQKDLLVAAGSTVTRTGHAAVASFPDADPPLPLDLPGAAPVWIDPAARAICATGDGGAGSIAPERLTRGAVELSGTAPASRFVGLDAGAVGVDTGSGFHVISAAGQRHRADSREILDVVGARQVQTAPWAIISLLPEGPDLSRDEALTATY